MECTGKQTSHDHKHRIEEEDEAITYAGVLSSSFILPMVLNACIELNVLEIINKAGPDAQLPPYAIASHLPTGRNPDAPFILDRMLHLLASYSLLTCSVHTLEDGKVQRRYGLTLAGKCFIRSVDGGSLAPFSLFSRSQPITNMGFHLKDAVLEGGFTFEKAHGMSLYQYSSVKDPTFGEALVEAMAQHSTLITKQILKKYKGFEGLSSLVDVGGGIGTTLNLIISQYPSIKGINFDVSEVLRNAPSYNGIEHVAGNMFEEIPKGGAIMLKQIIHNWEDEECLKILRNCYKVVPEKGKVIVIDPFVPVAPETTLLGRFASQYDNLMFCKLGGKERTENEFKALAIAAGFSQSRVACSACGYWVLEFKK